MRTWSMEGMREGEEGGDGGDLDQTKAGGVREVESGKEISVFEGFSSR